MKKESIYLAYLERIIHANGNSFKSKDEIFDSLDPKIDRMEFENYFINLNSKGRLEEHLTTGKWKLSTAADIGMILQKKQEDQERLRVERPMHKPTTHIIIPDIKKIASSFWKLINTNIIAQILGGCIVVLIIYLIKIILS